MTVDHTVQVNAYLSFRGDCEAAFEFYLRCLGGQVGLLFHYGGTPLADEVPPGRYGKIMHGSVTVGDQVIMGGDVAPDRYEEPRGLSMSLHIKGTAEADSVFHELAGGGRVVMPLEKTFWAARFGMLVDRFVIPWLISCEGDHSTEA